ncbi:MAG: ABC transporter substrate-binding protein [Alphaproteobacteria bacterium]|nr:ABC transporter substrate-binding protein [Alphaproteobacteria bacterium]
MRKCLVAVLAMGLALGFLTRPGVAQGAGNDQLRIGAVLSVTGPAAYLGSPELKTLRIYVARINASSGVAGRQIELVAYDDGSEAGSANSFAKRLIERDRIDFLIGGTTTGSTLAIAPLVERAGIPFISLSGGTTVVDPVRKWIFKTAHTDRMAAERVLEDIRKRGLTTIALLADTGGFGQSGRKETLSAAARLGISVAFNETYGPKDTDMTPQLTRIRAAGVQALFVFGHGQGPAIISRNMKMLGMTLPVYHAHGVASEEFIKLAGPAAEGARLPASALLVADRLGDNDPQKPVVLDYRRIYGEEVKEDVSDFGGYAYDALMILTDAIKRAQGSDRTIDRARVRDAIEETKGFVGTSGSFSMSPTDHMGLDLSAFRLLEIRNGEWALID